MDAICELDELEPSLLKEWRPLPEWDDDEFKKNESPAYLKSFSDIICGANVEMPAGEHRDKKLEAIAMIGPSLERLIPMVESYHVHFKIRDVRQAALESARNCKAPNTLYMIWDLEDYNFINIFDTDHLPKFNFSFEIFSV